MTQCSVHGAVGACPFKSMASFVISSNLWFCRILYNLSTSLGRADRSASSSSLLQTSPLFGAYWFRVLVCGVEVKVQIGTEKIAKEKKEDRSACVSCAEVK